MALDASGADVIAVTVPGDPNVTMGQPAQVEGLVALPWSQESRSGIVERADDMGTFVAVPNAALRHLPNRITFRLVASAHTMEGPEFSQDREGSGR